MLFGAHVSSEGGIDKAVDRGPSWDARRCKCSDPADVAPHRSQGGVARAVSGAPRGRRESGRSCHAVYLVNLGDARRRHVREVARGDGPPWRRRALEAEGVVFHVRSHRGAGFDAGVKRSARAARAARPLRRPDTAAARRTPPVRAGPWGARPRARSVLRSAAGQLRRSAYASIRATGTPRASTSSTPSRSTRRWATS